MASLLPPADPFVPTSAAVLAGITKLGDSERFRRLDRLESYYRGTQHQYKAYSWNGVRMPADGSNSGSGADIMPGFYVPMRARRPSAPYHLAKVIVDRFTALLFGEGRWPEVRVESDAIAEDFLRESVRAGGLKGSMIQARGIGGATGSVGLSYKWIDGSPRVEVHNPKHILVHEWEDRESLVPRVVLKSYKYPVDEYVEEKKAVCRVWYRYCREWTPNEDIRYKPIRIEKDQQQQVFEREQSVPHGLGFCPFVWIQNLPSDDIDGVPDYDGLTDDGCGRGQGVFDQLDLLISAVLGGGVANVDPTLVLKVDPALFNESLLRKGSQNALKVGPAGDAHYLELSGSSIDVGIRLTESIRKYALEVSQCVLADPEKLSGAAQSAKAIEYLYAPMLAKAGVLRMQYGNGLKRVTDGLRAAARTFKGKKVFFSLPPKVIEEKNEVTGDNEQRIVERNDPGGDSPTSLVWPNFFPPTPQDIAQTTQVAQTACGGKPVISQETAVKYVGATFGIDDIDAELERIDSDEEAARQSREGLFGGLGGVPEPGQGEDEEEGGVEEEEEGEGEVEEEEPKPEPEPEPDAAAIDGLPEEVAKQVAIGEKAADIQPYHLEAGLLKINEWRARAGLEPVAWGDQTVAEYKASIAERLAAAGLDPTGKPLTKKLVAGGPEAPAPFGGGNGPPPSPGNEKKEDEEEKEEEEETTEPGKHMPPMKKDDEEEEGEEEEGEEEEGEEESEGAEIEKAIKESGFPPAVVRKGMAIESKEHGEVVKKPLDILKLVLAHLKQDPSYYDEEGEGPAPKKPTK